MKEEPIVGAKFVLIITGFVLILFASLILFTQPSYWKVFNFSSTGQIGDTIGGITAPIINLIGAILVYISFKAQINANKIQVSLLNNESANQKYDRNFQVALELFKELKNDFKNLEYKSFSGHSAINVFVNEMKEHWDNEQFVNHTNHPIFHEWSFIINEYEIILNCIDKMDLRSEERLQLFFLVEKYYISQLSYPSSLFKGKFEKYQSFLEINKQIDNILSIQKKYTEK